MRVLQKIPYLLLFLFVATLSACKEDDDKPKESDNKLQYFECKINGEFFQAVSIPFQCTGPRFDYYPQEYLNIPAKSMSLVGIHCPTYDGVGIGIFGYNEEIGTINFNDATIVDSILVYYSHDPDSISPRILYEELIDGNVNIEQLVPRASGNSPFGTIKGTFEFTVTDEQGIDTIRVTEGRFRFDVPQIF